MSCGTRWASEYAAWARRRRYAVTSLLRLFQTGRRRWLSLLATHPPLEERILRLEPSFNGTFPASVPVTG